MIRHALASATLSALVLASVGCALTSKKHHHAASGNTYSGTASVGDFVTLTVDDIAHTIAYDNQSTHDSGTCAFTVNSDGTYTIVPGSDTGTMHPVKAYEIPGYAFMMSAQHTGETGNPSIITSVLSEPIAAADMTANRTYNYMQFRTNSGGMEIGCVTMGGSGVAPNSYWPFGNITGQDQDGPGGFDPGFNGGNSMPMTGIEEHGTYLIAPDDIRNGVQTYSYVFKTAQGFFAVDTPNGGLVCMPQAAHKEFDAATAGTYHAMIFRKSHVTTGSGNVETPAAGQVSNWTIGLSSAGVITVTDTTTGDVVAAQTLSAFADCTYLSGTGKVENACNGAFTVRIPATTLGDTPQDVFVLFMTDAIEISSFQGHGDGSYDYWYGVGLRDASAGG